MITFLTGKLADKNEHSAVIDVGGVGFKVSIPLSTYRELPRHGESVTLHTHLAVREDEFQLYGFATEDEREVFLILLSVSGVGAKMAIDVVSHLPVERLVEAIRKNEHALLCQVPGIGKKRAERIVFDLKNTKHPLFLRHAFASKGGESKSIPSNQHVTEAVEALIALGCKPLEAQRAIAEAIHVLSEDAEVASLIKEGLRRR
ncbi:MAG: Holliday junction branch migration protein RuvA [Candidatus Omnitrophota bacterium]|jgi:Holliday junction DNA helicase RuvA|nr:MAG: Holliday junction branch migration protein RuvA [Candidatus Omnitrophota bacterium]